MDPLPSWNDGAAKSAILDFVARTTTDGGPDFIAPAERIAVFDNDGTLWCEYPLQVQVFFALAEVKRLCAQDPSLLARPAFKAMVDGDVKALMSLPKKDVFEPAFATHAGMTVEEFHANASRWLRHAEHPKLQRPFVSNTYAPQRELLDHMRANGYKTYIVTGGGVEFVRVVAQQLYGIPPEQVVGSSTKMKLEEAPDGIVLRKLPELGSFDDRDEKVVNIALHIGRRPVFAFGNSDGDLAMIRYTLGGPGPRMAWYLHHDDAAREFAYDRDFRLSALREGLDRAAELGIGVVSMQRDWNRVFAQRDEATNGGIA